MYTSYIYRYKDRQIHVYIYIYVYMYLCMYIYLAAMCSADQPSLVTGWRSSFDSWLKVEGRGLRG